MRRILAVMAFGCIYAFGFAQTDYHFFVQFHDKNLNYVDLNKPETFLSDRSIERRMRMNVKVDSIDLPVTLAYITNITADGIRVRYVSKWLNGAVITVQEPDEAYRLKIKFFVDHVRYLGKSDSNPFGLESETVEGWKGGSPEVNVGIEKSILDGYNVSYNQINQVNGIALHKAGYTGKNMWIAVFDAGFSKANTLSAFDSLFYQRRLVSTYDLVDGGKGVFDENEHGMNVLGVMAANSYNKMIGTAPHANYVLFRTESKNYESQLEELNWVRAAEIADSMGVDVINSSLGYNTFDEKSLDHNHNQLDGKTAYISIGAGFAASRGMLVVNASGNDGNKQWKKVNFPADAIGILAVGAVDLNAEPPSFSSYGPTADFRLKPDVAALGYQTAITTSYGTGHANGTSFACPIISGMAACLWQADRSKTPAELISLINKTGNLSINPDNVIGHGVPDFLMALTLMGKNKSFNYNVASPLIQISDTVRNRKRVVLYIPNEKRVLYELTENKKFLFFKYQRTLNKQEMNVSEDGFLSIIITHPRIRSKHNVNMTIKHQPSSEKSEDVFSTSFVLVR